MKLNSWSYFFSVSQKLTVTVRNCTQHHAINSPITQEDIIIKFGCLLTRSQLTDGHTPSHTVPKPPYTSTCISPTNDIILVQVVITTVVGVRHWNRHNLFDERTKLDEPVQLEVLGVVCEVLVDVVVVGEGGKVGGKRKVGKQHDLLWKIGPV